MKKFFIVFFLIVIVSTNIFPQNGTIKVVKQNQDSTRLQDSIRLFNGNMPKIRAYLNIVEQMPEFQGGKIEYNKFIKNNIKYPQAEKKAGISGICYVSFLVNEDGTITDVQLLKSVPKCPNCDKEAIRVVSIMPKWIPGQQNGKTVIVEYFLKIYFPL